MTQRLSAAVFLLLALSMFLTRFPPVGDILHMQDASWAVFFVAGFYLKAHWRWAFPLLMLEAVVVDFVAIQYMSVSNYCATIAYWFLVPAYASLWLGGTWLKGRATLDMRGLAALIASFLGRCT